MSAEFTPGPWIVTQECGAHVIRGADLDRKSDSGVDYKWRDYVASTWGGENEANARLIASAPELLAALIYVQENVADDSPHMWEMAAKAIAAATGEQA